MLWLRKDGGPVRYLRAVWCRSTGDIHRRSHRLVRHNLRQYPMPQPNISAVDWDYVTLRQYIRLVLLQSTSVPPNSTLIALGTVAHGAPLSWYHRVSCEYQVTHTAHVGRQQSTTLSVREFPASIVRLEAEQWGPGRKTKG